MADVYKTLGQVEGTTPEITPGWTNLYFIEYPAAVTVGVGGGDGWQAVRFDDWKGIQQGHKKAKKRPVELYNLKDDIGETNDLAAKQPELVARVKEIFTEAHVPSEHFSWKK